jgi:hypothetical protein
MFSLPLKKALGRPGGVVATVATLCLGLGCQFAFAVQAAPPAPAAAQRPMPQDKLKEILKLTPAQSALLQKAEDGGQAAHKAQMDEQIKRMQERRKAMDAVTDKAAPPDLRKLAQEQDKEMDARMTLHKQVRDGWLNFYDSLDAKQKVEAIKLLHDRMAMHSKAGGKSAHRMGGHMTGMSMGAPEVGKMPMDVMPDHGAMAH